MVIKEFIANLEKSNFFLEVSEGKLVLRTYKNKVTREQIEAVKSDKKIIDYITENKQDLIDHISGLHQSRLSPQKRPDKIPLSYSQERLWFIDCLEGSLQYHMPVVLRLEGKLNKEALRNSIRSILDRHEVLRTIFREEEGKGFQFIKDIDDWTLAEVQGSEYKENPVALKRFIESLINKPFDLSQDYMLRAHLIQIDDKEHILAVTVHHIASDGWSLSVLVKEVAELYSSYDEGRPSQLPPLDVQYADYAIWQRQFLEGDIFEQKLAYWRNKLNDTAALELPADFSRPAVQSVKGASLSAKIDKELSGRLQEFNKQEGTTLFMTLLAAFKVLLFRYSGQNDICVGTPIAGRQEKELENLIGFFVNTLTLRTDVRGDATFKELLHQVQTVTLEAFENQEIPFEKIVDEVIKERSLSRNPLVQAMVVLLNTPDVPELRLGEIKLSLETFEHTSAKFDIQLFIKETPDGLSLITEYSTDLFTKATIKRMMAHFKELLSSIIREPDQKISALPMLSSSEEHQLLVEMNNNRADYPKNKNVVDLFEEQVLKTPDSIAVIFEEEQMTYAELNKTANRLAHYLRSRGIGEESLVALCLERSLQMMVAIWGILKAGAAYVPIDPEYPAERISYMLEDTAASLIITTPESHNKISVTENFEIVKLDAIFSIISKEPSVNLNVNIASNHLAYVIYTSGSTGKPKGAMNEHSGLANRLFWAQDYFKLTHEDAVLQKTTFCFDVSVWELLWPVLTGAKLVFAKPGGQKDNAYLTSIIEKHKISILHFVPSMLGVFLPDLHHGDCMSIDKVLCSGEALKPSQVELFRDKLPHAELHNLYGPTEAAIDVTCWSLRDHKQVTEVIPIGKPVSNTSIYILDERENLSPMGGVGEIHIGGIQVSRGYLNRPELTAQKFITNPFIKDTSSKLYKTGDLGRWMADGNIEYLGRKDDQVKIRGYRIELGEIEAVLEEGKLVKEAVVLAKTDKSGNTKLVSYYVPAWETVKEKERELYLDRVANWKELYDTEYSRTEEIIDEEFNLIGWNSTFTGQAIPETEMKQWVDDIIDVILSGPAENVLEIGCGTGLIYYPLAGKVKKYIGTDLSITSINQIRERISKGARDYGPTELIACAAHEVSLPKGEKIDTIILNSIVQYFPGEEYMNTVVNKGISLLNGKGRIVIGDVRDNRLLDLFKGRLQSDILKDNVSIPEFKWAVEQEVMKENELCFDPAYFFRLKSLYKDITHVEIQWKKGDYINELSLYRYTVIIYVGNKTDIIEPRWVNWEGLQENEIISQLKAGVDIAINDAPNPRLWKERDLHQALQDKMVNSVGELLQGSEHEDEETKRVLSILNEALQNGYHWRLLPDEDPLKVNIILEHQPSNRLFQNDYKVTGRVNSDHLTNVPLFTDISWKILKDLRAVLQKKLPDYMVPAEMIALRNMPLTSNGKVDRKFLSQREERIALNADNYVAPSTVIENLLVTIWQELLGLEQIGIDDNFFEVGGDSILTIQIVSRLRTLGYELQPKDVFNHQTIGRLAKAMADHSGTSVKGEQGELKGLSGLLPIQQWYFQNDRVAVSHFNQSILLEIDKEVTSTILFAATVQLVQHHDALRFRYTLTNNGWQQEYDNNTEVFCTEDLRSSPKSSTGKLITGIADKYQRSLDIEKGELMRVVWIQTPDSEPSNRLFFVIHHLAVDGVSWRILLQDMELMLGELINARKPELGIKSTSYRQWYDTLKIYGQSTKLLAQKDYWQGVVENYEPFDFDKEFKGEARLKDTSLHSIRFGKEQTRQLLKEVPRVYHTEINDILLSVLAKTLTEWTGKDKVIIGLEGHGREDIAEGIDTSRTVGWFTSLYPLLLKTGNGKGYDYLIKTVKEQLRKVPDKGLGYGILKYINGEPTFQDKDPWDIIFNYLGQLDNVVSKGKWLKGARESAGAGRNEEKVLRDKLSVNSSIAGGQLVLTWSYSNCHYEEGTITQLAENYISNLESLITHCLHQQKTGIVFTPSDYGLGAEISNEELDRFLDESYQGIPRRKSIEGLYRLSSLQQGMLFHGLYSKDVLSYNENFYCDLIDLDVEILKKSWNYLFKRHSIFRSAFYHDEFSVPVQCVYRDVELSVKVLDYRGMGDSEQRIAIKEYEAADHLKGLDFKQVPLMRLELIRMTDSRYRMLWTYHHILFDGWSLPIVLEGLLTTYESLVTGKEVASQAEDRFEDYIRYIERRDKDEEKKYWQNYLNGIEQSTLLPFVKTTNERTKGAGEYASRFLKFGIAPTTDIQAYAQRNRLTVNTIMQGVWSYLLHSYTGHSNISYGVIVSGRPDDLPNVEERVGMFINTLPLHSKFHPEMKVAEWLQNIQVEQVSSRQFQHTPLQDAQKWAGVQGDLFDTLMVFENYPVSKVIGSTRWSLKVENLALNFQTNYPLSLLITSAQEITVRFDYNAALLDGSFLDLISRHFENVLLQLVKNTGFRMMDLNLLTPPEEDQLLYEFNDNQSNAHLSESIIGLFEQQVLNTPDAIALIFKEEKLSFAELNERSNQLAHYLRTKGVKAETMVPVFIERGMEMVTAIFGILKAGGAFVPVDPQFPADRISYILKDTAASMIVTNAESRGTLRSITGLDIIEIKDSYSGKNDVSKNDLKVAVNSNQLAYVIYTSGSTGKPKGVMIEQGSLVNYILNNKLNYLTNEKNNTGSFIHLSYTFDASLTALFMPLLAGKAVVIASGSSINLFEDANLMQYAPYDFIKITPSHLELLEHTFKPGSKGWITGKLVLGGEALHPGHFKSFIDKEIDVEVINEYGPTESTVGCSTYIFHTLDDFKNDIPIGMPIDNIQLFVLNNYNGLTPVGVAGELYIGGSGLARGYLNLPELTSKKFVPNPFKHENAKIIYRTGDLARWLPDGNLEYLDRKDDQVKIRGYRIELGEIENNLQQLKFITQSAVLAKEDSQGHMRLIGYIVAGKGYNKDTLISKLREKLPEYMVPQLWVELEDLPLTSNGKIDKKNLPDPDISAQLSSHYVAPRNQTEQDLADIWQELLGLGRVGIFDNFFESGGDSILTIQMVSRAGRKGYHLQPKDIFVHQTIERLCHALLEGIETKGKGEQGMLSGEVGLIPVQQWYLNGGKEGLSHFNQSILLSIDKAISLEHLEYCVRELGNRHDALRMVYSASKEGWKQEYGVKNLELSVEDLTSTKEEALKESIHSCGTHYQQSLDIEKGELARLVWIQTPKTQKHNRFLMIIHHLAIDGVSWRILIEDLEIMLDALTLNQTIQPGFKTASFRQWYNTLEEFGKEERVLEQLDYWKSATQGYHPIQTDTNYKGAVKAKDMVQHSVSLSKPATTLLIREVSKVYHTEINDLLLCALAMTIAEWTRRNNVLIGLEGHGRESISDLVDTSRTVGWFTSLYPVIMELDTGNDIGNNIRSIKEQLRNLPDKGLGYGVLKYINKAESLQGNDSWDIVFNYLGQLDNATKDSRWFHEAKENAGAGISPEQNLREKLSINSRVQGGELIIKWTFSDLHFKPHTIEKLADVYVKNLEKLITHCEDQKKSGSFNTPSDYGLTAEVHYKELDKFLNESFRGEARHKSLASMYRLSGLQQGMLFHSIYDGRSEAYIEQFSWDLAGMVPEFIEKSWNYVLKNHSILRSAFYHDVFKIPVQCVYSDVEIPLEWLDYSSMTEKEQKAEIKKYEAADVARGFDLKSPPLMRLGMICLGKDRYRMVWTSHHILFDGWSVPILTEEFLSAYEQLVNEAPLTERQEDKFEDYIRYVERDDNRKAKAYWVKYLEGVKHGTLLPFIEATSERNKGVGKYDTVHLKLDAIDTQKIQNYAKSHRITLSTLMQGVWSYLLHCYTGKKEITFGVTVSGRPENLVGVEKRVGMFINTLPLYSNIDEGEKLGDWLKALQEEQIASRNFQFSALHDIQSWIGIQGDLFDSIMVFENYPVSKVIASKKWSLAVEEFQVSENTNYPLSIIIGSSEQINIHFSFNCKLLDILQVSEIRDQFEHILFQIVNSHDALLGDLKLLSQAEELQLLENFNHTNNDYPLDKTIVHLFEEQALKNPQSVAIEFGQDQITYKTLNENANQLARYLTNKGVTKETLVPICIERIPEMITGILGILKSGGAYVPIDPEYPVQRINSILEETKAKIVLSSRSGKEKLTNKNIEIIELDSDWKKINKLSTDNLPITVSPNNLAYIIFTSGSTGKPKGVLIEHKGVINLVYNQSQVFGLKPGTKCLQFASIGFDASCSEIFNTLLYNGSLVISSKEKLLTLQSFEKLVNLHKIDIVTLPPAFLEEVKDHLGCLKVIVSAGDKLNPGLAKFIRSKGVSLINAYGPTENTVCATETNMPVTSQNRLVIGKPLSNVKIYIMNDFSGFCRVGIAGEICIGGMQVARGYLNNKKLTKEKFIKDPYDPDPNARLYKTGDLGRWLQDGNIEFLGRIDEQVKIRGYLVEISEIESALSDIETIHQSLVLAKEDKEGNKHLVGYLVTNNKFNKNDLLYQLREKLPEFMVPQLWVELKKFPFTRNGKIDRDALPDIDIAEELKGQYVQPRNPGESKLAEIWLDLLSVDRVGINDNFFELGGHSLKAMRLISEVRTQLNIELGIKELFRHPTIASLALHLSLQSDEFTTPAIQITSPRPERIPLSFGQERLWFIDRLEGSLQYHMPSVLKLSGALDPDGLNYAIKSIIERHEVLRTVIKDYDGEAYQQVNPSKKWKLEMVDGSPYQNNLNEFIQNLIKIPFNLSEDFMLRGHLIKLSVEEHYLVVTLHHIASDGWSISLIVKELVELYESKQQKRKAVLPSLDIQYADYAIWQQKYLQGDVLTKKITYWKDKLEGITPLELPTDFQRPAILTTKGAISHLKLNQKLSAGLNELSQKQGTTLFMTLLAAFKVLLYRYSGHEDICVGIPIAGRQQKEVENLVGYFINTLALRTQLEPGNDFIGLLQAVKTTALEAYENQEAPFEKIIEAVISERDLSRHPLFQVMFVFQNTPEIPQVKLGDVKLSQNPVKHNTSKFELTFHITEVHDGLNLAVEYCTDLYQEETISRMQTHFRMLLDSIVMEPTQSIGELEMLTKTEEKKLLDNFNKTKATYSKEKTIKELFEEQVLKTPEAVAIVCNNEQLTYNELNGRANQLAHYLKGKGVKEETLVPICIDRGLEMIIGILGILKSGGAYVPIDPEYPLARINYILEDTKAKVVIGSKSVCEKVHKQNIEVIELDSDWPRIAKQPASNLTTNANADNLAYIIYTSGSTGQPKGVLIENRNIVRLFFTDKPLFDFNEKDVWTLFHSFCFDFSVWEMYGALLYGGRLIIVPKEATKDAGMFADILVNNRVTVLNQTPSAFYVLQDIAMEKNDNMAIRYVIYGGEALNPSKLKPWKTRYPDCRLINMYGITETTVHVTYRQIEWEHIEKGNSNIGKPIPTLDAYILDRNKKLVPPGISGELYIGGAGLARGYLNNKALTDEKFIHNPFSKEKGARLYKTGDLGRWLPDGDIEYLGRIDDQVKIRGYRIELGEIENALQQVGTIGQSLVMAKGDKQGNKQLVAYITAKKDYSKEAALNILRERLPEYMVPQLMVELEAFPLTPNGKIDRKALPEPEINQLSVKAYVAPGNDTEKKLAAIWEDILSIDKVGIHDDFFEIGGHSLMAMKLISAIRKELGYDLKVKDLFTHTEIAVLALFLTGQNQENLLPVITSVKDKSGHIPLSFSQERLWFIDRLEGSLQYHVPIVLTLKGSLNIGALNDAIKDVFNRQHVLRTVFKEADGRVYQVVMEPEHAPLHLHETGIIRDDTILKSEIQKLVSRPFDLSADPMLRCDLIRLSKEEYTLVVTMHHIASDAWSIPILIKEVVSSYNAFSGNHPSELPPLPLQYADYASWQRTFLDGEVLNKKLDYWKQKLDGIRPLELPTDFKRPPVRGIRGAFFGTKIKKGLLDDIYKLNQQQGTTLYMSLLAAFNLLLYRYSGQEDISVGASITNRPQQELENLVGFFVNTIAFRNLVTPGDTFKELLEQVKTTTIEAYEHQDVPFEKVVEAVVRDRDPSRSPVFQVMLILVNIPEKSNFQLGDVEIIPQAFDNNISKFDISLHVSESSSGLNISVEYSTDLYRESTIAAMMEHYKAILSEVAANPGRRISEISMLSEPETRQLTTGFNTSEVIVPKEISLPSIFATHASNNPNSDAVMFEGEKLSYSELDQRANQLAHALIDAGVKPGTLVPLYMDRGIDMIAAMLGIMKAGCAYVPIDRDFPRERIEFMIEDTAAKFVVCDRIGAQDIGYLDVKVITMELTTGFDKDAPACKIKPQDPAYVIYTSGSTGKPKGVIITHHNLTDYIFGLHSRLNFGKCRSFALVSSIATDLGNTVIFSSWFNAGVLHLFSKQTVSDAHSICQYFDQHPIDCLKIVPSHWKALCTDSEMLLPKSLLIFGGELLEAAVVQSIQQRSGVTIVNHYGPTETTIGKLLHEVQNDRVYDRTIPIGTPFGNTAVYVISPDKQLCPKGVPGELFIGGEGLAKAYLNLPQLTLERFIDNPYKKGQKIYATGDLVKYNQHGEIEYLGRTDDQVKIRGYRIELGEIETAIAQSDLVQQAVVLLKLSPEGSPRLTAYILTAKGYQKQDLLDELKLKLPEYMIPSKIMELESFPLLANGKVDRKALPDPDTDQSTGQYIAPRNQTEEVMAELWQEILEVDKVGMSDDFFELGGHSLLAIRLVSAIRKAFEVEMPIGDIFDYPTIGQLAERIAEQSGSEVLPPITKNQTRPERIPLSFSQERLWFIDKLEGSVQYHIPSVLRLKGELDIKALENAIGKIVERHEVLRTVILENEGEGYQLIKPKSDFSLNITDGHEYTNDPKALQKFISGLIRNPFDLAVDDMIRVKLIRLSEHENILVVVLHHIASDGWSTSILVEEVVDLYKTFTKGSGSKLKELAVQYADYAIWQRHYLQGEVLEKKLDYWKQKLLGVSPIELPTDMIRPAVQSIRGLARAFKIDKAVTEKIRKLSLESNTTMFMTLLATFKLLLHRYSGQDDICVGTPVAGRQQQETESLIGFFINTLALRSPVNDQNSFKDLLQVIRKTTMEAYAHQEIPFEKVVEAVVKERDMSRSAIFQVLFVYQNTPDIPALKLGDVELSMHNSQQQTVKFELTLTIAESPEGLTGNIQYCTDLYKESTIDRMAGHLGQLLEEISTDPHQTVSEISYLTKKEETLLLKTFNHSSTKYPKNKTIVDLFETRVNLEPETIAVVYEDEKLSYSDFNKEANQVANYLLELGVQNGTPVAVCLERSASLMVAVMGILKAGGAYLPIDPDYPQSRIEYILEDSGAEIVMVKDGFKATVNKNIRTIDLDKEAKKIKLQPVISPGKTPGPKDLIYIIYTSGSTGNPKGVMIEHSSLLDHCYGLIERAGLDECKSFALFSHLVFDAGHAMMFSAYILGATLHVLSKKLLTNPEQVSVYIRERDVDCIKIVPTLWQTYDMGEMAVIPNKVIIFGGEFFPASIIQRLKQLSYKGKAFNHYGPTEATIGKSIHAIDMDRQYEVVPIGKPFSNTRFFVLDPFYKAVSIGVPGELFISGDGLARGYFNRDELTNEKFITNPINPQEKMYRTGDMVRWLEDGNIEYIGRFDDQVKIRGYRIELGEIESVLLTSPMVSRTVVVTKTDILGDLRLVCYLVAGENYDREKIQTFLKARLPEYMLPVHWVEMETIPLTSTGKIDRRALPDPDINEIEKIEYVAPRNETEQKLVQIWQDLLGVAKIGVYDNFFELGGHSLLAMRMIYFIERELLISIPIQALFQFTSINDLARYIEIETGSKIKDTDTKVFKTLDI